MVKQVKPQKVRRSYRLSEDTIRILATLTKQYGINETAVVEMAVHVLADKAKEMK